MDWYSSLNFKAHFKVWLNILSSKQVQASVQAVLTSSAGAFNPITVFSSVD